MNKLVRRIIFTILSLIPLCLLLILEIKHKITSEILITYILAICISNILPLFVIKYHGIDYSSKRLRFNVLYLFGFIKIKGEIYLIDFPHLNSNFIDAYVCSNNSFEISPFTADSLEIQLQSVENIGKCHITFQINTNLLFFNKIRIKTRIK